MTGPSTPDPLVGEEAQKPVDAADPYVVESQDHVAFVEAARRGHRDPPEDGIGSTHVWAT